jgi:hypothetical protein
MQPNNSPLEHLAAFAIAFAAGMLSAASLAAYIARVQRTIDRDHRTRAQSGGGPSFSQPTRRSIAK